MKQMLVLILFIYSCFAVSAQKKRTVLAVFPHPDDETVIAEVMIRYTNLGYHVQLMIATDGKDGTRVTSIPAGDSLGTIRKEESRCACRIMGVPAPIFLGIERLDTKIGVGKYFREHKRFLDTLKQLIPKIDPDVLITFGPDGDTHHSEHIVTGATVTELLLQEGWVEKYPLYHVAWTKTQGTSWDLGYVNDKYMNVRVDYSNEDELKALEAFKCYVTQYTPKEMRSDHDKKVKDTGNFIHFRKFVVQKGMQRDLFQLKN